MIRYHLILLIILLFLSGCAQKISPPNELYSQWQAQLAAERTFSVNGKIVFISTEKRQSASLNWRSSETETKLNLSSFIGTNILSMAQTEAGVSIEIDGETYQGDNAQQLIYRLTGFNLPFVNGDEWLKGLSKSENAQFDDNARLLTTTLYDSYQSPWQLSYDNYQQQDGYWLPHSIRLSNDELTIKLRVNAWQF